MFKSGKRFFLSLCLYLLVASLDLYPVLGSNIQELIENTYTPSNIATGGVSSNIYSPQESGIYNPALHGALERTGGNIGFSFLRPDSVYLIWGQFFFPGSIGTLSTDLSYAEHSTVDNTLKRYFHIAFAYSRKFTKSFSFGLKFKPAVGDGEPNNFYSLGMDPSLLFEVQKDFASETGLGLYDLNFYLLSQNLAFHIGDKDNISPRISTHLGSQFAFFKKYEITTALNLEIVGIGDYSLLPVKSGIFFKYKFFNMGLGYSFGKKEQFFNGPSLGVGFDLDLKNSFFSLYYSFFGSRKNQGEYLHSLSLQGSFGAIDKEPPNVELTNDIKVFSPNWDGKKDYVHLNIKIEDDNPIKEWKLTIKDSKEVPVRTFASSTRDIEKSFGIKEFFLHFFKRREYLVVPSTIRWDGNTDPVLLGTRSKANEAPDGTYTYTFTATDIKNNKSKPFQGYIKLDKTPPKINASALSTIFSPNNDRVLETLSILHERAPTKNDHWKAQFTDSEGKPVKTYQWEGYKIPSQIAWNGKDDNGEPAPEGLYTYKIIGSDNAGNTTEKLIEQISLVRSVDAVDLNLLSGGLSPNSDKIADTILIKPVVPNKKGMVAWKVSLTEKPSKGVHDSQTVLMQWSGERLLPNLMEWNGRSYDKEILNDGKYYLQLDVRYRSGNHPYSLPKEAVIDTEPPELSVDHSEDIFSPDGDGEDEEQIFKLDIEDDSAISKYTLNIYESAYQKKKKKNVLFKKFKGGRQYPKEIIWDGKGEKGSVVESASEYQYQLLSEDIYGNKSQTDLMTFETDILVLLTKRGLKIRISNVEFDLGKATLKRNAKKILKKLSSLLEKYSEYNVNIEGHTDDLGGEDFNLKLSELRAKSVMKFLIWLGVNKDRLGFQGLGETTPILPNKNWYNRSRNRRVEFILTKKK